MEWSFIAIKNVAFNVELGRTSTAFVCGFFEKFLELPVLSPKANRPPRQRRVAKVLSVLQTVSNTFHTSDRSTDVGLTFKLSWRVLRAGTSTTCS